MPRSGRPGIIVRQGLRFLRQALPDILAKRTDVLSPRMVRVVADLASDSRQLDERIEPVTDEIETLAKSDDCTGHRPDHLECDGCSDRQRRGVRKRPGFFGMDRARPQADVDRGPNHPRAHHQARQRIFTHALRASCPGHSVAAGELAEAQLRGLARSRCSAPAPKRFGRGSR